MSVRHFEHAEFWKRFVGETGFAGSTNSPIDALRFADDEVAQDSVSLILSGSKTAMSLLRADVKGQLPEAGSFSILENAEGQPVAVLERTQVSVEKFSDIDDAFARAHGEWGGSLKNWRRQCRANFAPRCRAMKAPFSEDTELVCVRFKVVYDPAGTEQRSHNRR